MGGKRTRGCVERDVLYLRGVDSRGNSQDHSSKDRTANRTHNYRTLTDCLTTSFVVGILCGRGKKCIQSIGFEIDQMNGETSRQTDGPQIRSALGLVHIVLPDKHQRPHAANTRCQQSHEVRISEHFDISFVTMGGDRDSDDNNDGRAYLIQKKSGWISTR